jgi:hypothetical protein
LNPLDFQMLFTYTLFVLLKNDHAKAEPRTGLGVLNSFVPPTSPALCTVAPITAKRQAGVTMAFAMKNQRIFV